MNNGFPTGYLNNGKEINEANVTELLTKAQALWPNEMRWAERTESNNNWYQNPGFIVTNMFTASSIGQTYNLSANYACGGYAAMISDYLFGSTNNPVRTVTNFADLRPGDIIYNRTRTHAMVVVSKVETGSRAGAVFVTSGNVSGKVEWPTSTSSWYAYLESDLGGYIALTRYPD